VGTEQNEKGRTPAGPPPDNGRGPAIPVQVTTPAAEKPDEELIPSGLPPRLPVLPLGDLVVFPGMIVPLVVNTPRSMKLVDEVVSGHRTLLLALQRNRSKSDADILPGELHAAGCLARLIKMLKFPDDTVRILAQGVARCELTDISAAPGDCLRAGYDVRRDVIEAGLETEALARNTTHRFQEIITLSPTLPDELKVALFNLEDAGKLTDLVAANLSLSLDERQSLLAEVNVKARLVQLLPSINREYEVLRAGLEIQNKVNQTLSKNQREYFLREQLKTIRSELGESDPQQAELQELQKAIEAAGLPPEARKVAEKEKSRLVNIPTASPEYAVIRTYLDWLLGLPWAQQTEDRLDIAAARAVLDADHYGLAKIKERILEYLAVLKLKKNLKGPILCLVGPPGVGKTSLGQSIARALGRKFIRLSLGGVHDEAEIRGHRRTYIGALPGRIIQGLRRAGANNPVFMLDEVDKIGQDFRGDPSSALLEALDPEQNSSFSDHYLDVPFDLSRVLFITTANVLDPIPPPLRDRMEVLDLAGYTLREKLAIAKKYLVPKQLEAHGLSAAHLALPDATLEALVTDYTREAGVRNLEREIASLCRKTARAVAERKRPAPRRAPDVIPPARLRALLGPRKHEAAAAERRLDPGVATGLAWTPTGGDLLYIEATRMPGKGDLILTGSLGEVMKESARAALSYVRAHAASWGLEDRFAEKNDFHIHVPAGAIPKDGPSAGLALTAALLSLLTGRAMAGDLALTGEITLRGKVLPVGGIKEKVLAADRAGLRRIILPRKNKDDLSEIPADIRKRLRFRLVENMDAAVRAALSDSWAPPNNQ